MKRKKKHQKEQGELDTDLLREYMMGATNPSFSNKIEASDDIIDLHIEKSGSNATKIPPHDALFVQLEQFEKALDKAIASGKLEFRVIHGLGKGKLKSEIHKILDKHPHVRSYENIYHSRYGFGSTLIILQ